ncbi:MAG TPA: CDP-alcohol phosphatidyltransferase family protein [Microthrixaceae bacterium]|nr:CDP-alcohol phosphatidyltransferase family protein [Microthrixaceae bacterium]
MTDLASERTFGPSAILTPANAVTIARLLLAPLAFAMILGEESSWLLVLLWFMLTTTDSLDGYLARKQGTTRSGAFLDPLADKVLALGGLWAVVIAGRFWWVPVALITLREALISLFRYFWSRRGLAVQASKIAKLKTFLQFGAVGWVVLPATTDIHALADSFLWLAVAIAWISAAQYVMAGSRATSTMSRD